MFGSTDDDDLDFNPAAGSKLASLFGLERSPDKGNSSLTYTAPKQPKPHLSTDDGSFPSKRSGPAATSASRLSLILMKVVTSFKLTWSDVIPQNLSTLSYVSSEDGNYNPQGKLGMALLGNSASKLFQLLLYKGKQQQITTVKISPHFQFTVQPHLYATFYDDRTQNWSVMFENREDAVEFTTQVAVARFRSASPSEEAIVSQEVLPGKGDCLQEGETVKLKLNAQPFSVDSIEVVDTRKSIIECTLSHNLVSSGWAAGVVGATDGSVRVILVPLQTQLPWLTSKRNDPLLIKVNISSQRSLDVKGEDLPLSEHKKNLSSATGSGVDSALDSGAEDSSIRARGACIKEALINTPQPNKASIISRMARMGQATLPLKGAIPCNPSDSEETEEDSGITENVKPPIKARPSKSRTTSSALRQPSAMSQPTQTLPATGVVASGPGPVTVVPSASQWNKHQHNIMPRSGADNSYVQIMTSEGQLVSLSSQQQLPLVATTSAIMSPSDPLPQFSMLLSEARMQNTEMRMHLSKVSDKMDQLMNKVDNLHPSTGPSGSNSTIGLGLEPNALLLSIEKLVRDNQSLQTEVAEKNKRLDEQNDRIFTLLSTNSKFLEQSSSLLEQKQLQEQRQQKQEQQQVEHQQQIQIIQQMREEKASLGTQLASLQKQLATSQELVQALQKSNTEINQELEFTRNRLQDSEKIIHEKNVPQKVADVENQLFELTQAIEEQKEINVQLQEKIVAEQATFESEKKTTESFKNTEKQYLAEISQLKDLLNKQATYHKEVVTSLEVECEVLKQKIQMQPKQKVAMAPSALDHVVTDVKSLMNTLHKGLNRQFTSGESYEGSQIRKIISSIVKREALSFVGKMEQEHTLQDTPSNLALGSSKPEHLMSTIGGMEKADAESSSDPRGNITKEALVASISGKHEDPESGSLKVMEGNPMSHPEQSLENDTTPRIEKNLESHNDVKKDQDYSFENPWRPLPPPPPLFHDDDDSDDWLP